MGLGRGRREARLCVLVHECLCLLRGVQCWACQCNVRSEEEIGAMVDFALDKMGRIDGLGQ
jgi:NAD(P)-dependent dehydrogenase (short-subunit alcohol dehydrogenase family)